MANIISDPQALRKQFRDAHNWLESIMQGLTLETIHWQPPGKAHPIGSQYIHVLYTEDHFINSMLRKSTPLMLSTFTGKTGGSELQSMNEQFENRIGWARRVRVEPEEARLYAQAVYAVTDSTLAQLTVSDLEHHADLSDLKLGSATIATLLTNLLLNICAHSGEIVGLKGLLGFHAY